MTVSGNLLFAGSEAFAAGRPAPEFSIKKVTNGQKSKVKINKKTGKVTIKKKTKKCNITVQVMSRENAARKALTKTVTIKVK